MQICMRKCLRPASSGATIVRAQPLEIMKTQATANFDEVFRIQDEGWQPRFDLYSRTYKVKRKDLTRLSGFAPRTIAAWAAGEKPSTSSVRKLVEIHRFLKSLAALIEPSAVGPWLRAPNPAFDGATPLQLFERGEADRLWRMIYELESGQPG